MMIKRYAPTARHNSTAKNHGLARHLTVSFFMLSSLLTATSLQAACHDNIIESTPTSQFTLNGDGTATDNRTGLMWMRCSLGQTWDVDSCTGPGTTYNWQEAISAAQSTVFAGSSNWRLPNIKELASIAEENNCYSVFDPAVNTTVFPKTSQFGHWSSTPDANNSANAWQLFFVEDALSASKPKNYTSGGNGAPVVVITQARLVRNAE